jgi:hypothetical protein
LEACLTQFGCNLDLDKLIEQVDVLLESTLVMITDDEKTTVTPNPNPSLAVIEPVKLDLKPLPDTHKYKFLVPFDSFPVIIASNLVDAWEEKSLDILREHKEAMGKTIDDIKGISLLVVMYKIN